MGKRRQGPINKKVDFLPNKLNKYSIRKFTVGTASILLGSTLIFGSSSHEAKAAEEKQVDPITQANQNDSSERSLENTNQPTVNNEAPQMSSTLQAEEGGNAEAPQSEPTKAEEGGNAEAPQSEPTKTEEGGNAEAPNVPTIKANSDNDTQTQFSEAPTRNDLARKEDIPAVSKNEELQSSQPNTDSKIEPTTSEPVNLNYSSPFMSLLSMPADSSSNNTKNTIDIPPTTKVEIITIFTVE